MAFNPSFRTGFDWMRPEHLDQYFPNRNGGSLTGGYIGQGVGFGPGEWIAFNTGSSSDEIVTEGPFFGSTVTPHRVRSAFGTFFCHIYATAPCTFAQFCADFNDTGNSVAISVDGNGVVFFEYGGSVVWKSAPGHFTFGTWHSLYVHFESGFSEPYDLTFHTTTHNPGTSQSTYRLVLDEKLLIDGTVPRERGNGATYARIGSLFGGASVVIDNYMGGGGVVGEGPWIGELVPLQDEGTLAPTQNFAATGASAVDALNDDDDGTYIHHPVLEDSNITFRMGGLSISGSSGGESVYDATLLYRGMAEHAGPDELPPTGGLWNEEPRFQVGLSTWNGSSWSSTGNINPSGEQPHVFTYTSFSDGTWGLSESSSTLGALFNAGNVGLYISIYRRAQGPGTPSGGQFSTTTGLFISKAWVEVIHNASPVTIITVPREDYEPLPVPDAYEGVPALTATMWPRFEYPHPYPASNLPSGHFLIEGHNQRLQKYHAAGDLKKIAASCGIGPGDDGTYLLHDPVDYGDFPRSVSLGRFATSQGVANSGKPHVVGFCVPRPDAGSMAGTGFDSISVRVRAFQEPGAQTYLDVDWQPSGGFIPGTELPDTMRHRIGQCALSTDVQEFWFTMPTHALTGVGWEWSDLQIVSGSDHPNQLLLYAFATGERIHVIDVLFGYTYAHADQTPVTGTVPDWAAPTPIVICGMDGFEYESGQIGPGAHAGFKDDSTSGASTDVQIVTWFDGNTNTTTTTNYATWQNDLLRVPQRMWGGRLGTVEETGPGPSGNGFVRITGSASCISRNLVDCDSYAGTNGLSQLGFRFRVPPLETWPIDLETIRLCSLYSIGTSLFWTPWNNTSGGSTTDPWPPLLRLTIDVQRDGTLIANRNTRSMTGLHGTNFVSTVATVHGDWNYLQCYFRISDAAGGEIHFNVNGNPAGDIVGVRVAPEAGIGGARALYPATAPATQPNFVRLGGDHLNEGDAHDLAVDFTDYYEATGTSLTTVPYPQRFYPDVQIVKLFPTGIGPTGVSPLYQPVLAPTLWEALDDQWVPAGNPVDPVDYITGAPPGQTAVTTFTTQAFTWPGIGGTTPIPKFRFVNALSDATVATAYPSSSARVGVNLGYYVQPTFSRRSALFNQVGLGKSVEFFQLAPNASSSFGFLNQNTNSGGFTGAEFDALEKGIAYNYAPSLDYSTLRVLAFWIEVMLTAPRVHGRGWVQIIG